VYPGDLTTAEKDVEAARIRVRGQRAKADQAQFEADRLSEEAHPEREARPGRLDGARGRAAELGGPDQTGQRRARVLVDGKVKVLQIDVTSR
jgi:hypothetical protein